MEHVERRTRATRSLRGLALGDAFGQQWFRVPRDVRAERLASRVAPPGPVWNWTDDTAMAVSVVRELEERGAVDQDSLALRFAAAYHADDHRGYGGSMHGVLRAIHDGASWREVTAAQFRGQGSWGNGAAMRVAPLGAWFAGDGIPRVTEQAALSARTTHAHAEAVAGAVAVAVAAALASDTDGPGAEPAEFLADVARHTPDGEVRAGLRRAVGLSGATPVPLVAQMLGSGHRISAADTVPFALWTAAHHLDDLTEALWATATGLGDIDTTCAITGGVVACRAGLAGVDRAWTDAVEEPPGPPGG